MEDSQFPSWKDRYLEVITETSQDKLTHLLLAIEDVLVHRLRELRDSAGCDEERAEIKRAAADLLVIKTYKLGWPAIPTPSSLMA